MSEQGWLIESFVGGSPVWFRLSECNHSQWRLTTDASQAVRFSRQKDAEQMLHFLRCNNVLDESWKVSGHEWIGPPTPPKSTTIQLEQVASV